MAVKIRMKRVGAKNAPVFRIVVADGRSPRDGKFIEEIGTYQPLKKGDNVTLDLERANYWVSKGAQPSDTVASFLKKKGKAAAATAATDSVRTTPAPTRWPLAGSGLLATPSGRFSLMHSPPRFTPMAM